MPARRLHYEAIRERFAALDDNDDAGLLSTAKSMIGKF